MKRNRTANARAPERSLKGQVVSGSGVARLHMAEDNSMIGQKIGANLVDGTLNLILSRPTNLLASTGVRVEGTVRRVEDLRAKVRRRHLRHAFEALRNRVVFGILDC